MQPVFCFRRLPRVRAIRASNYHPQRLLRSVPFRSMQVEKKKEIVPSSPILSSFCIAYHHGQQQIQSQSSSPSSNFSYKVLALLTAATCAVGYSIVNTKSLVPSSSEEQVVNWSGTHLVNTNRYYAPSNVQEVYRLDQFVMQM